MPPEVQSVIAAVAAWVVALLVAGGGLAAVAFWIFKLLSEKWLNAKFAQRLEAYRHTPQRELEQLKFEISALMDRTVKLHQKEFDVLPEAWGRLTDAHGITTSVTAAFQQYPNLEQMNKEQLEEFLESSPLQKWQRTELKSITGKNRYYMKAIGWQNIVKAQDACREFHVYLLKNGIFIPEPLKAKFVELDEIIYAALVEHELNHQEVNTPREREAFKALRGKGAETLKSLEADVQGRLWKSERP
jgi:hypothetical protein